MVNALLVTLVALLALAVSVVSQPSFANRVSSNLLFQYNFLNSQCQSGAFTDSVVANVLGGMSYPTGPGNWNATEKCPTYVNPSGTTFRNAYNGVRSQGLRTPALVRDDATATTGDMTTTLAALGSGTDFSFEFWMIPRLNSGLSTSRFVIMEIGDGSTPSPATSYNWRCETDQNFDAQIYFDDSLDAFSIRYRFGPGAGNCQTVSFSATSLSAGSLYHVVVTSTQIVTARSFELYLNGANVASGGVIGSFSFAPWEDTHRVRIGSSPFTLSSDNNAITGGTYSWPGDILLAAMYSSALTPAEVLQNFDAKLANSRPVAALAPVTFVGNEDQFTRVELNASVFDFDEFWDFVDSTVTYVLHANPAEPGVDGSQLSAKDAQFGSAFEINNVPVTLPLPLDISGDKLEYRNSVLNSYGARGKTFELRARDNMGSTTAASATVRVELAPTNDAPTAVDGDVGNTAQASVTTLEFRARDLDCDRDAWTAGPTLTPTRMRDNIYITDSCTTLGQIANITVKAPVTDLGILYRPTGGVCQQFTLPPSPSPSVRITSDVTFTSASPEWFVDGKDRYVKLCFEGCFSFADSDNNCTSENITSSILGTANFTYEVTDSAGGDVTGILLTQVTNALEVEEDTFERLYEGNEVIIVLTGRDNFCETIGGVFCPRDKAFELGPLPDPSVGRLYAMNDLARATPLVDGAVLLPELGDDFVTLRFRATPGYFNMDYWPLCGSNVGGAGSTELSACATGDLERADFACKGPDCGNGAATVFNGTNASSSFTTMDLLNNPMGGCTMAPGTDDNDFGCPVKINYAMIVDGLKSGVGAGVQVWVKNINDEPVIQLPGSVLPGIKADGSSNLVTVNGSFIQIVDPDGDTRIMDLVVTSGRGEFEYPGVTRNADNFTFTLGSGRTTGGINQLGIRGTLTTLNDALRNLRYLLPITTQKDEIFITLNDVNRGPNSDITNPNYVAPVSFDPYYQVEATFEVEVDLSTDTEDFTVAVVVLWSSIVGGSLLCIGCCYGVMHAIFRRALMGERAAMWFVRNILLTHVEDHPEDEGGMDLRPEAKRASRLAMRRIHAERVTMSRVRCCVHFFACVCPCFCKFDPKNSMPTEGAMLAAATLDISNDVAKNHVPTKDNTLYLTSAQALAWELHEHTDPRTGKVRPFLFNPHDGRSVWKWVITDQEEG